MTENQLVRIPVITNAILQAQPLNIHSGQMSVLEGMRLTADKIESTLEVKNDIGEALLRLYRDAGQRFSVEFPRGGNGSNQHGSKEQIVQKKRLADYGYNPTRAALCRSIASIPEELFESEILSIRLKEHITEREITTKYFANKVGFIDGLRKRGISTDKPQPVIAVDSGVEALAATIKRTLTAQQIAELVKLLTA